MGRCGRNFHVECIEQRRNSLQPNVVSTCPSCHSEWCNSDAALACKTLPGKQLPRRVNLAAHSSLHAAPMSMEETYPQTHQWIQKREGTVKENQPAPGSSSSTVDGDKASGL